MALEPRKSRKRSLWPVYVVLAALVVLILTAGWFIYEQWKENQPNQEHVEPTFGNNPKPVFYRGEMLKDPAAGEGERLMLSLDTIIEQLDPYVHYEEQSESVIITTSSKVIRFKTDQLTAWVNEKPLSLSFPIEKMASQVYVPVGVIESYYRFETQEHAETGAVLLFKEGDIRQWASAVTNPDEPEQPVALRTEPDIKAPILADLASGEKLLVWSEEAHWYRVQTMSGWIGYVQKNDAVLGQPELIQDTDVAEEKPVIPWKPLGGKINLTWEHVVSKNPDTSKIGEMPGLNVISPTWFALADDEGTVSNKASKTYLDWAHKRGYQVWALFSNDFDPDRTKAVLSNYDTRMNVIRQLLGYAELYGFEGINIDFENVYLEDKEKVTQFVRELTPYLHEQGLVVSIDVTIRGGSPMWSLFLDRKALGQTVDYMMVMTYDEHWASSPVAGSVASLPWTEKGITDILREDRVPASKLLIGVPYYTRIWSEETVDGKLKVSSKAVGMEAVNKIIRDKKLEPELDPATGQDYVEYKEDDVLKRIWIENERSMQARIELVKKYDLAGVASWRRGFEAANIWDVIKSTLEQKP